MTDRMDLIHRALDGRADAIAGAGIPTAVTLRDLPITGQIALRGDPADTMFMMGTRNALGFDLPTEPNTVTNAVDRAALWLSPDEWLVIVPFTAREATIDALRAALAGRHVLIADVSANRVTLELSGPKAREVIAKGCGLDLHSRAFRPGQCAQTVLARSQALIWQIDEAPTYRLLVRPSFAGYVADFLIDAMREYTLPAIPH